MTGKILSCQIAEWRTFAYRGNEIPTGIYKLPVAGPVRVATLGLEGDMQADPRYHGGIYKAVYFYPSEHYPFWREQYPTRELPYGMFGENLTSEGLLESEIRSGDLLRAGDAVFKVTTPREPCFKLGAKFNDKGVIPRFRSSGRPGFYVSVLEEGVITAGDAIERIETDPRQPTILDLVKQKWE